ncbi:MAG: tRNA (adenosine(37)-N6)-threonylcarbamoyltransferase complex ATPase subunit type 1 TsaE [Oscillospiraceae bacterium]|nr:tRNA (adenosine(37)-N6)-threonylcarbamoyltransferase complex ATPase subunit type 1 TsaE [Oscillospiraceae bacterium]
MVVHCLKSEGRARCVLQEWFTHSIRETEELGAHLAGELPDGSVLCLYGELGAGKTAFVRGLAEGLGITATVCSPTFTIVNEYPGPRELIHFDMYRLHSADELFDIGWEDYRMRDAILAVEWSENVEEAFDGTEIRIRIDKTGEQDRRITAEGLPTC